MSDLLKMMTKKLERAEEAIDFLEEKIQSLENELDLLHDNMATLNECHGLCELNEENEDQPPKEVMGKFHSVGLFCPTCNLIISGIEGDKHECIKS